MSDGEYGLVAPVPAGSVSPSALEDNESVSRIERNKSTILRAVAERAFPKLLHYGRTPEGCHFAAWEQPKIFTDEVRASFKTLRK